MIYFQNRYFENNFDFTVIKFRSSHKMESSILWEDQDFSSILWEDRDFITVKSKLVRDCEKVSISKFQVCHLRIK